MGWFEAVSTTDYPPPPKKKKLAHWFSCSEVMVPNEQLYLYSRDYSLRVLVTDIKKQFSSSSSFNKCVD